MLVVESDLLSAKKSLKDQAIASNGRAYPGRAALDRDTFKRINTRHICQFARQLATLLRAGMPLVPALSALVEQLKGPSDRRISRIAEENSPLAAIVERVRDSVNEGATFAEALAGHSDAFSPLFVNMVAAGEAGGTLEEVLLRLAEMLEKRVQLAGKVKAAVAYPVMMAVVAAGVVGFLLSFVVPSIAEIFVEMNRTLPWPTTMLIAASTFTRRYFVIIAAAVCAVLLGIGAGYRTREGRLFIDRLKLRLPLFGTLFLKVEIARLTRTLGMLLASGMPILGALQTAKSIVQNRFIADALEPVEDSVRRGQTIASAIERTGVFPPVVYHVIATGQISGNLEEGLIDVADMYDNEVEITAKTMTSLLEPAILLVMGMVVGFIVLAILLPIFEINQAL